MEIRLFYVYISCCALTISYIEAKSVSLNELIAAEEKAALAAQHTTRRSTLFYTLTGTAKPAKGKKTSPLKYRQNFRIASSPKLKKSTISQKLRHKRKNFNKKREANHNDGIIQKYIPLLKNIRMLVDNILTTSTESSETYEHRENKFKRNLLTANERAGVVCTCERKPNSESTLHPQEEAVTSTTAVATEIQEAFITSTIATTTQTLTAIDDNVRRIGRHKNVPVLPTRNSTSVWRNDSRLGQGSSSSFNRSFERYITRNNGDNGRDTRQEIGPHTENYEEYTDSYSRDDAGCDRSSERLRRLGSESRNTELGTGTIEEESTLPGSDTSKDTTRNLPEHERKTEHEIRRNETESSLSVPELDSRLRGFESQEEVTTIRSTEISKESVTKDSTSDKRFFDRNGSFTSKNQEISATNEAVAPKHVSPNSSFPVGKVVMIFDGYSVAKDVNGANRLTEKAIQIHT